MATDHWITTCCGSRIFRTELGTRLGHRECQRAGVARPNQGDSGRRVPRGGVVSDERQRVASGTQWEQLVGCSRAVRVERFVYVSGTTATDESGAAVGI